MKMSEKERRLLLGIAHLQNEILILTKSAHFARISPSDSGPKLQGQIVLSIFYVKLLAGKLNESWEFLHYSFLINREIVEVFNRSGSQEGIESLNKIKKYFGRSNLINHIRNKYAFHYDPKELEKEFTNIKDDLDLYMDDKTMANNLNYFAELPVIWGLFEHKSIKDRGNPLSTLENEIIGIGRLFVDFTNSLLSFLIRRNAPEIWDENVTELSLKNLPKFTETRLHWFSDTSGGLR